MIPDNLAGTGLLIEHAEIAPGQPVWAVWERLDHAGVSHVRYLGILPQIDGETPETLTARAGQRFRAEENRS